MQTLGRLLLALALIGILAGLLFFDPLTVRGEDGIGATGDPVASCTAHESLTTPPETIRVLRNRTGRVEIVSFRTYVYRTHAAEFWTEYRTSPYSDALLGAGAVAIKQNAWLWTMTGRNWWGLSATNAEERGYVSADYADDNQINGSAGNPAKSRQGRADQNAATALRMRIRYGADLADDGIGGISYDPASQTYEAPLAVRDDSNALLPIDASTPRSCFDVIDHPSMNQFYATGGLYEPGYNSGTQNNARYNRAVDATWGLTIRRSYALDDFRMWRPGFYGSFNNDKRCLLRPSVGDTLPMRHISQPSHYRGWSFFPENADTCAKEFGWTTEELLRQSFFSWEGESNGSGEWTLSSVTPIRLISPATDLTGDGRGDLLATNAAGSLAIVSADSAVDGNGRYKGAYPGRLSLDPSETLLSRLLARTGEGGALAVSDLRRSRDGALSVLSAAFAGGTLDAPALLYGPTLLDPTGRASLHVADLDGDGLDERLLATFTPLLDEPENETLTLARLAVGAEPLQVGSFTVATGSQLVVADFTGDRVADLLLTRRLPEGTLTGSFAVGNFTDGLWSLGELSVPGALLYPLPEAYILLATDAEGVGSAQLYLTYRDPKGLLRIVQIALRSTDSAAIAANPDLILASPVAPQTTTTARAGETTLAAVATRTGLPLDRLLALNDAPYRTVTIKSTDSYATIAKRVKRSEACLRTMNANKKLVGGKSLRIPLDLCRMNNSSKIVVGTPIRIYPPQLEYLRVADTIERIVARGVAMGLPLDAASLAEMNPTLDLSAPLNSRFRLRLPWSPLPRSIDPAAPLTANGASLGWSAPKPLWRGGVGGPTHQLLAIEWTGDGVIDLLLAAPPVSSGTTLYRLAFRDGLLAVVENLAYPHLVSGWTLR